jgi:hypothetical protein
LSYGVALLAHAYGFLAVFAAGLALRATERQFTGDDVPEPDSDVTNEPVDEELATHPEKALPSWRRLF